MEVDDSDGQCIRHKNRTWSINDILIPAGVTQHVYKQKICYFLLACVCGRGEKHIKRWQREAGQSQELHQKVCRRYYRCVTSQGLYHKACQAESFLSVQMNVQVQEIL